MVSQQKLDELKPVLKHCQIFEGDSKLVVENPVNSSQVVLPKENIYLLNLLNGENSIKDISEALFKGQGQVSFHAIFTTIRLLKEVDLLENMDHEFSSAQDDKAPHEQKASILQRSVLELSLGSKVQWKLKSDWLFCALVLGLLSVCFIHPSSFQGLNFSGFLKSHKGHESALLQLISICSILMTMKALFQGILLLASAGSFYRPVLRIFPYAISLGLNDNSLYSHPRKAIIISYGIVSSLLYLISFSVLDLLPVTRPYHDDVAILAIMLTFIELNPYRRSDLTKLFYFFYAENQLKNIMPYLKNCTLAGLFRKSEGNLSDELRYITYSVLSLSWAIGFSLFSFDLILQSFPALFYQIQLGTPVSKYSALTVMLSLLFITGYLTMDLFHTLIKNIISPVLVPLNRLATRPKKYKARTFSESELLAKLKRNMVFNQMSDSALEFMLDNAKVRTLKKDAHLIFQGSSNRDVYFLLEGRLDVTVREQSGRIKHLVTLSSDTVIGEMAILEQGKRTAHVTAAEDIVYLEFPEAVFTDLLERFQKDFEKLRSRIEISQFVASADIFKEFPPEIMNLFVEAGDLVLFPGGHNVVEEGERDKTFYLLIKGKVDIYKQGQKVAALGQGDFFGEVALIANVPRTATVHAVEESLFLYIEDKKFWSILSQNIELAMYIESVGRQRMVKAA